MTTTRIYHLGPITLSRHQRREVLVVYNYLKGQSPGYYIPGSVVWTNLKRRNPPSREIVEELVEEWNKTR